MAIVYMALCRVSVVGCRIEIFTHGPMQDFYGTVQDFWKCMACCRIGLLQEVSKTHTVGSVSFGKESFSIVLGVRESKFVIILTKFWKTLPFMLLILWKRLWPYAGFIWKLSETDNAGTDSLGNESFTRF